MTLPIAPVGFIVSDEILHVDRKSDRSCSTGKMASNPNTATPAAISEILCRPTFLATRRPIFHQPR